MKDLPHTVTDVGCRGKGQIANAERYLQSPGDFAPDKFTDTGDFVCGSFNDFRDLPQAQIGVVFKSTLNGAFNHAGSADTDIDNGIGFADTQIGAGHKGDILRYIGKGTKFGAGQAVGICGQRGGFFEGPTHSQHRVDVDSRPGGGHIDRCADPPGLRKSLGDSLNQGLVAVGDPLFHQGGEPADKIDIHLLSGLVQCMGHRHQLAGRERSGHRCDGADGDTFVDDGDAVFVSDSVANNHQIPRQAFDF